MDFQAFVMLPTIIAARRKCAKFKECVVGNSNLT